MGKGKIGDALSKRIGELQGEPDPIDKAYNDMFGPNTTDGGKEKITEIDISLVKPHPQDPFKPYPEEKLKELAESIANVGLLDPINIRPAQNGEYEILTGKNRTNASRLNGDKKIKAIIRDVDDDTAIMIITDSNLKHREKLLPSEKAYAYKLQLEAVKNQGKRSDLAENGTSVRIEQKLSRSVVAEINDVTDSEIQRYIRLTNLLPELLDSVDNDKIPLMAGVDLSFLDVQAQKEVHHYFSMLDDLRLDLKTSAAIKQMFQEGRIPINADTLTKLLNTKTCVKKPKPFSINRNRFKGFTDKLPGDKELEDLFIEFLRMKFGIEA